MIKTSILSAVLMTSALLHTPEVNARVLDPSSGAMVNTGLLKDVYSGVKFNYLNKEDRLLVLKDLLKTVELQYALLPLKKQLIGLNYEKLKADAIAAEEASDDILLDTKDRKNSELRDRVAFLQASSNMDFIDRMTVLIAQFKDTHFGIYDKIARPFIYTGLRFYRIDGKIVVSQLETKFLGMASKLSGADLSTIKIGDEVISIDGVPVEDKIKELKPYISGSSDDFIDSEAIRSLTLRNVKYEKKNFIRVVFKNAGTIKLPIFSNSTMSDTPRLDAITFLNKFEIPSDTSSIGITFDQTLKKWTDSDMSFIGYRASKIAKNLKDLKEYVSDSGSAAIRTGYFINKGKTYAVLQVLTFSAPKVKNGENALAFIDALRNFVLEVKESEVPLILDLRVNNGGNGSYPSKLMSMLIADTKAEFASSTEALRMTQYIRQINEGYLVQRVAAEDENEGMTIDMMKDLIDTALDNNDEYTPMHVMAGTMKADPKVGGFPNKIVTLVSPDCISACDKTAFLIQSTKRSPIIGSHSNGTGAGFTSSNELNTQWSDRLNMFSATVPNYLFGRPGALGTLVFGENSVLEMCSENKPTPADIQYKATALDLNRENLGWLQKAAEVLESNNVQLKSDIRSTISI
ncbi:S41 family peptidase [Bacteriovorax sp. PP10]|uniref:S41 family peptidase n=1 Tax=Bacteriovorax antarcticus TaxID=3088717 RepID=A0ABU5VSD0_9BACT|nr:S41 family peptidase [Bacteriovorax sp. PP10]MEA9355906.1 S41 family peptidase [Bacteriovorax sp. PP10]